MLITIISKLIKKKLIAFLYNVMFINSLFSATSIIIEIIQFNMS